MKWPGEMGAAVEAIPHEHDCRFDTGRRLPKHDPSGAGAFPAAFTSFTPRDGPCRCKHRPKIVAAIENRSAFGGFGSVRWSAVLRALGLWNSEGD